MDGLWSTVLQVQNNMFKIEGLGFSFEVQGLQNIYIILSIEGRIKKQATFWTILLKVNVMYSWVFGRRHLQDQDYLNPWCGLLRSDQYPSYVSLLGHCINRMLWGFRWRGSGQ
jgi:hypothetical protein